MRKLLLCLCVARILKDDLKERMRLTMTDYGVPSDDRMYFYLFYFLFLFFYFFLIILFFIFSLLLYYYFSLIFFFLFFSLAFKYDVVKIFNTVLNKSKASNVFWQDELRLSLQHKYIRILSDAEKEVSFDLKCMKNLLK